ncbi:hypothetical protein [Nocardia cyriacigeorgica]
MTALTTDQAADLLAELDAFAARAAASSNLGAATAVTADLAAELLDPLADLADVAGIPRPRPAVFDAAAVAARSWGESLCAAVSSASEALSRTESRRPGWEAEARRFDAGRHIARCRTALRTATRRLDGIEIRAAERERMAERGTVLHSCRLRL